MLFHLLTRCPGVLYRTPKISTISLFSQPKIVTPRINAHREYTSYNSDLKEPTIAKLSLNTHEEIRISLSPEQMPLDQDSPKKKKQSRSRKVAGPATYNIEDVDKKETNFQGRLGYVR